MKHPCVETESPQEWPNAIAQALKLSNREEIEVWLSCLETGRVPLMLHRYSGIGLFVCLNKIYLGWILSIHYTLFVLLLALVIRQHRLSFRIYMILFVSFNGVNALSDFEAVQMLSSTWWKAVVYITSDLPCSHLQYIHMNGIILDVILCVEQCNLRVLCQYFYCTQMQVQ